MSALVISILVFIAVLGGAVTGAILRVVLPKHHVNEESKDAVRVGIGLIATLAALVLGLLVASAKNSFDTKSQEIAEGAAKIILLDRDLRQYGPEANPAREYLRRAIATMVNLSWVESGNLRDGNPATPSAREVTGTEELQNLLWALAPTTDAERALRARALQLASELARTRWLLLEQKGSSIPMPFLVVLVLWLMLIFGSLGLFAPRNGTVSAMIFVCALSVSSAIFLVLEMDRPFDGLLRISDGPLRTAIGELNR